MTSFLLCDDHSLMRQALAGTVRLGWPDAEIVEASDFAEAEHAIITTPDICITDLVMPGAQPLKGVERLRKAAPDTPILVITGNDEESLLLGLFDLGVAGYIPKTAKSAILEAAIRLVLAGGQYLPPRLLDLVAARDYGPTIKPRSRLTERQAEVLTMIADGKTSKEIARELCLSPATVKAHTAAAISALGASNRTDAVVRARELDLI